MTFVATAQRQTVTFVATAPRLVVTCVATAPRLVVTCVATATRQMVTFVATAPRQTVTFVATAIRQTVTFVAIATRQTVTFFATALHYTTAAPRVDHCSDLFPLSASGSFFQVIKSAKLLIWSINALVQSACFSLKMQPRLFLLPITSHGLTTSTVSHGYT